MQETQSVKKLSKHAIEKKSRITWKRILLMESVPGER